MGRYRWRQRLPSFAVLPILHYCNRRLRRRRRQFCRAAAAAAFSQAAKRQPHFNSLCRCRRHQECKKKRKNPYSTPVLLGLLHFALGSSSEHRSLPRFHEKTARKTLVSNCSRKPYYYYIVLHTTTQYYIVYYIEQHKKKGFYFSVATESCSAKLGQLFQTSLNSNARKAKKGSKKAWNLRPFSSVSTTTFSSTFLQVSLLAILYPPICYYQEGQIYSFLSREEFSYKQCEVFALYQIPCGPSILSDLGCILQSIFLSWPKKQNWDRFPFFFTRRIFQRKTGQTV